MKIAVLIIFIFCAALASGSILLSSRLIREHPLPLMRSLFYHIIFIFAFGFYGVWGQFIIVTVAGSQLTPDLLSTVSVVSLLMGMPFLVFGWMMLLRFGSEYAGYRFSNYLVALFLLVNFGLLVSLGVATRDMEYSEGMPLIKYYYSGSVILFSLITAWLIVSGRAPSSGKTDRRSLAAIIAAGAVAQAAVLLLLPHSVWMALAFVFLLFAVTSLLPVYLTYQADPKTYHREDQGHQQENLDEFCRKNEISPREADIIREICNGLSNQEIADKLFISLQTVKDHTSRIYSKTNVRNRMQLMTMVRRIIQLQDGQADT
ncbi:MAG: LuxR C-terminal-related transcriptional regulator [Bacteroidales bacterium]|jgi:DNA-binding CsgD family transcriptional regulator|nr:LuxR C-terminal-related transcriptional regulator [Bacteroidales bacterium]